MPFKYIIDFVTQADLVAVEKTEKAVAKVGTEADKTGSKLKDLGTAGDEGGKGLVASLSTAGEKGGKGLSEGIMQGVLGADAIGKVWELGSMIGEKLGEGMTAAWEAGEGQRVDAFWAALGSGEAQARIAAEEYAQEMSATLKTLNAKIAGDSKQFWADYNDTLPKNASDWIKDIGTAADEAKAKLQGLSDIQAAIQRRNKSALEQDYLDKKDAIENDPMMSKSDKMAANAANDAAKVKAEADLRAQDRLNKAKEISGGVKEKGTEVQDLTNAEAAQKKRAEAYEYAKAQADNAIAKAGVGGGKITDQEKDRLTNEAFTKENKRTGLDLAPKRNEMAALEKAQAAKQKAEADYAKQQAEAKRKINALAIDQIADDETVNRTQARTQKTSQKAVTEQRQKEWQEESEAKAKRETQESMIMAPQDNVKGPTTTTDNRQTSPEETQQMRDLLTKAAETTGNAGQKANLEELKRALSDGGSVEELKQATALIQQMQVGSNGALRGLAEALRQSVAATAAANQNLKGDIDGLKAAIAVLQNRIS